MRSPTKLKEGKSHTGSIVATIAHNAHEYQHKHAKDTIPKVNQKGGYVSSQWVRRYKAGKLKKAEKI